MYNIESYSWHRDVTFVINNLVVAYRDMFFILVNLTYSDIQVHFRSSSAYLEFCWTKELEPCKRQAFVKTLASEPQGV